MTAEQMDLKPLGFEANYCIERLDGFPMHADHEFVRPRLTVEAAGLALETPAEYLWLRVTPDDGPPWIGAFECGPGRLTGLFATPCPEVVCVVSKGQGFWVPVPNPTEYEVIQSIPIQQVFAVPGKAVLVFVDYTGLEAYGPGGALWRTERLSWDGLKVAEVTADLIRGTAWDSPANCEVPFSVDTENGTSDGGSSPTKYERS